MSETFGEWELLTLLGKNELGDSYLALRPSDQRKAVLKRFSASIHDDATFWRPLALELELASRLQHPSAAAILELGEHGGTGFVAMECIDGPCLSKLVRAARATQGWPLSMGRAVALVRPVLDALRAAHALPTPLLHRDLVPENVFVTEQGRVVVIDFGLGRARLRAGSASGGMRRAYVSPEQARGNTTDPRSEVFAAGLILFELVCGRLPVEGAAGEVISRIATGELDAPLTVNPQLDPRAAAVLDRALALRPEARFSSAGEFFDALAPWAEATAEEPLGTWAARLDGVKIVAPAPAPPPEPNVAAEIAPAAGLASESVGAPPRTRRWSRLARWSAAAAGVFVLTALQLDFAQYFEATAVDPLLVGRPLELTSIPSGALVYVDGVLLDRRTPVTLSIPKDELRSLIIRKNGFGQWSGPVSNTRSLEVTLPMGERVEVRYEGARPVPKEAPAPAAVAAPAPAPAVAANDSTEAKGLVFDAEAPPLEVLLTARHAVRADTGPITDIPPTASGLTSQAATVYLNPPPPSAFGRSLQNLGGRSKPMQYGDAAMTGVFRSLGVFALKASEGRVEVVDLSKPAVFSQGGQYHLFLATEGGTISVPAEVRISNLPVSVSHDSLLRVHQEDSFLIRTLSPDVTYRVEVTADQPGQLLPPVLMSMRPEREERTSFGRSGQSSTRFDGQPLATSQVILSRGKHTLTGVRSAWFTILTASGVVPSKVTLTVKPVSPKKLR